MIKQPAIWYKQFEFFILGKSRCIKNTKTSKKQLLVVCRGKSINID
ncbi:hypothetical protein [Aliikangiella maris]|uniref:Uncharacterized protein n=1 Tax=Aliikangiella maris TaxID=3162458 RepID=A0ABV3MLC7_9GAMM